MFSQEFKVHYHFNAGIVRRSRNDSSVKHTAYNRGTKYRDDRSKKNFDFSKKVGVIYSELLFPPSLSPITNSSSIALHEKNTDNKISEIFWNKVEAFETRIDAQIARIFTMALPRQLKLEEWIFLVKEFLSENFLKNGFAADFSIHHDNLENPHVHITVTMRKLIEDVKYENRDTREEERLAYFTFENRKDRNFYQKKELLINLRSNWAFHVNNQLEKSGFSHLKTSEKSYIELGINKIPEMHLGRYKNKKIEEINKIIREKNSLLKDIQLSREIRRFRKSKELYGFYNQTSSTIEASVTKENFDLKSK